MLVGDFNEDGLADILVYYWGRSPVIFLRKKTAGVEPGKPAAISAAAMFAATVAAFRGNTAGYDNVFAGNPYRTAGTAA